MVVLTDGQISRVAGRLLGTTDWEETALEGLPGCDDLPFGTAEDVVGNLGEVFALVDRCQGCGWWFEIGELSEEYECGECAADEGSAEDGDH